MKVSWEVNDNYNEDGMFEIHIDDDVLSSFKSEEEREQYIEECVDADFEQKISPRIFRIVK